MSLFQRNNKQELSLTISAQTFVRVILLIIGTIIILAAIRKAQHALVLVFIAFFLALALNAPVQWVHRHLPGKKRRHKTNRAMATTVSFLIVIILIGAFLALLVPPLVRQTQKFINAAPGLVRDVRSQNSEVGKFVRQHHLSDQVNKLSSQLQSRLKSYSGSAVTTILHVGSSIFSLLAILVMTFMMLVEGPRWVNFGKRLIPHQHKRTTAKVVGDMYQVVRGYVNGQVLLAAIAAAFLTPALFILGVSYPLALIVVVFICALIPLVGHTIGAIIVTLVALFHSPLAAIIILAYYIFYINLENYVIQPRIQSNTTNLSPLLVFVAVVIGLSFSGIIGGLVAIPAMGCLRVLVLDFVDRHKLMTEPTTTKPA